MESPQQKLIEITKLLKGDWKIRPERSHKNYVSIVSKKGLEISIRTGGYQLGDRGEASVNWPQDIDGSFMSAKNWGIIGYNEKNPFVCGFTMKKESEKIAKDIERKVLKNLDDAFGKIQGKLLISRAKRALRQLNIKKMCDLLETKPHGHDREQTKFSNYDYRIYGHVNHNGSIDLEIKDLSIESALDLGMLVMSQEECGEL